MGILVNMLMGNGTLAAYHDIYKFYATPKSDTITVTINSYIDEDSFLDGGSIVWQQPVDIPVTVLHSSTDTFLSIQDYLITNPTSKFVNGKVSIDRVSDLDTVKSKKIQLLDSLCSKSITKGFESDALGSVFIYPAKALDQSNLVASVLSSTLPGVDETWSTPFWCMGDPDVWAFRMHTASQIQEVGKAGKAAIVYNLSKNELLASQVREATSIEEVSAVVWDEINVPVP